MAFDVKSWKEKLGERFLDWKTRMHQAGVNSIYAFVSAATVWPVVEAAKAGDWSGLTALGGMLASLGSGLLANRIQGWKDEADAALDIQTQAAEDPTLRAELDEVLEKLDAFTQASAGLKGADQGWFARALQAELKTLGNLDRFQAQLEGSGAIAQGPGARAAGERGVVADSIEGSSVFTGDVTIKAEDNAAVATHKGVASGQVAVGRDVNGDVIVIADPGLLWRRKGKKHLPEDLVPSTEEFLSHLVDRYRYLDFRGMGVTDRVALRLPLTDMYVPLKARIELPQGETWTRLKVAGRRFHESEPETMGEGCE